MKNIKIKSAVTLIITALTLTLSAQSAGAHVSIQSYGEKYYAGGGATLFLRVPHAKAGLTTVKLVVQLPENIGIVKPSKVGGWVESSTLSTDGKNTETITWDQGSLPDTSFQDFGMKLTLPNTPGKTLYFKAVQYLSDGSTENWVEIPSADNTSPSHPAPAFTLVDKSSAVDLAQLKADLEALKAQVRALGTLEATSTTTGLNLVGDFQSTLKRKVFTITDSKGALLYTGKFNTWGDFDINIKNKKVTTNEVLSLNVDGNSLLKVVVK